MKKTLIALAVAASAAVSGSAMAWTANGTGGSVDLGGTLTPADVITPWEVKVGAAVNGLNADIRKGDTKVEIPVKTAIPVLGIRTVDSVNAFKGQPGIIPIIDFNGAIGDHSSFDSGLTTLTLSVKKDGTNENIGSLTVDLFAGAGIARSDAVGGDAYSAYFRDGAAFSGGLGGEGKVIESLEALKSKLNAISPEFTSHFVQMDKPSENTAWGSDWFANAEGRYSAFYGSGIEQGKTIKITLKQPAASDAIAWKASLPVTVSYQ